MTNTNRSSSMEQYELIDTTDNDSHDTGSEREMRREADARNRAESADSDPIGGRWVVRREGYAATHFKG